MIASTNKYFRDIVQKARSIPTVSVCLIGEGLGATLVGLMIAMDTEGLVQCGVMVNPVTDRNTIGNNLLLIFNNPSAGLDIWTAEQMTDQPGTVHSVAVNISAKHVPLLLVDDSTFLPLQLRQTFLLSSALVQAHTVFRQMVGTIITMSYRHMYFLQVYPARDTDHEDAEHGDILDNLTTHQQVTVEQFMEIAMRKK